jgi:hypothetical protein
MGCWCNPLRLIHLGEAPGIKQKATSDHLTLWWYWIDNEGNKKDLRDRWQLENTTAQTRLIRQFETLLPTIRSSEKRMPNPQWHMEASVPRYETTYPGMKFPTQGWNFLPRHEISYPGMKFPTLGWNFLPRHEISYPGMKFPTQAWNFLPKCKTCCVRNGPQFVNKLILNDLSRDHANKDFYALAHRNWDFHGFIHACVYYTTNPTKPKKMNW